MNDPESTRDKVRALVRDVLANAVIIDDDAPEIAAAPFSNLETKNAAPNVEPQANFQTAAAPMQQSAAFDRDESEKTLLTEADLRGLEPGARVRVRANVRLTPLADDLVRERNIELVIKSANTAQTKAQTVAVGADHGGFEFKERLKEFLFDQNLNVRDFGTNSEAAVDYPDFAFAVANAVAENQADVGIVIDGAGIGSAMTANKIAGIRAAACYNPALAKNAREHNGANVLTLGSKQNSFQEICEIVTAFLATDLTEERHRKRVEKITAIERESRR